MKKLTKILTATIMTASLTACGSGSSSSDDCKSKHPEIANSGLDCEMVVAKGSDAVEAVAAVTSMIEGATFSGVGYDSTMTNFMKAYDTLTVEDRVLFNDFLKIVKDAQIERPATTDEGNDLITSMTAPTVSDLTVDPQPIAARIATMTFIAKKCVNVPCDRQAFGKALYAVKNAYNTVNPGYDLNDTAPGSVNDLVSDIPTFVGAPSGFLANMVTRLINGTRMVDPTNIDEFSDVTFKVEILACDQAAIEMLRDTANRTEAFMKRYDDVAYQAQYTGVCSLDQSAAE